MPIGRKSIGTLLVLGGLAATGIGIYGPDWSKKEEEKKPEATVPAAPTIYNAIGVYTTAEDGSFTDGVTIGYDGPKPTMQRWIPNGSGGLELATAARDRALAEKKSARNDGVGEIASEYDTLQDERNDAFKGIRGKLQEKYKPSSK